MKLHFLCLCLHTKLNLCTNENLFEFWDFHVPIQAIPGISMWNSVILTTRYFLQLPPSSLPTQRGSERTCIRYKKLGNRLQPFSRGGEISPDIVFGQNQTKHFVAVTLHFPENVQCLTWLTMSTVALHCAVDKYTKHSVCWLWPEHIAFNRNETKHWDDSATIRLPRSCNQYTNILVQQTWKNNSADVKTSWNMKFNIFVTFQAQTNIWSPHVSSNL